ncbi:MAG: toll/interleukin-1 receptor domain-containing protein [Oscillospiraceae bacterium]|nr:toll/interleukin-1 receptor domain-containing protein [Oscillospiraceae bacterium]
MTNNDFVSQINELIRDGNFVLSTTIWSNNDSSYVGEKYPAWLTSIRTYMNNRFSNSASYYLEEITNIGNRTEGGSLMSSVNTVLEILYKFRDQVESEIIKPDLESFPSKSKFKKPKIFISHSSKDIKYIEVFVEMLKKMGLRPEHLFCSSISGYGITFSKNIYDYLFNEFEEHDLYIIYMLSKDFYNSADCLNEMGVTWALKIEYGAILIPPWDFKNVVGAIDKEKISFKLDDTDKRKSKLNDLKNIIINKLGFQNLNESVWEDDKTKFIESVDKIYNENLAVKSANRRIAKDNRIKH